MPPFIRLNLLLLAFVAFLPFPTRLFADYIGEDQRPSGWRRTIYLDLPAAVVHPALGAVAVRGPGQPGPTGLGRRRGRNTLTQRLTPGLGGYVVLIILGLFVPVIAVVGYLAIACTTSSPVPPLEVAPPAPARGRRPARRGTDQHREGL